MKLKTSIDFSGLDEIVGKLTQDTKKIVEQTASEAVLIMRQRIKQGKNSNDALMPSYSTGYKKTREKRGRQTQVRDLLFTGRLLGDIHVLSLRQTARGWTATIGFSTARGRLLAQKHQRDVRFFGFSPNDLKAIRASLDAKLRRSLDNDS